MEPLPVGDLEKRIASLSAGKRAVLERRLLEMQSRDSLREPIAIVGMGCRFPGGANSPEAFWQNLVRGVDAIVPVPADRWDNDAFCDPAKASPDELAMRWGGFVNVADQFDPAFFGISPKEAARMDPQQRMVLEVAWEALEDAGIPPQGLGGTQSGVFIGVQSQSIDYYFLQLADIDNVEFQTNTGGAHAIVANRLSYFLDLRGPSFTVDTACSSSLVALHLACQSLRTRECDLAFAGGTNLIAAPETSIAYTKLGFMAPDGRCKTFDARANGFVRGEGCGIVVLKRLSDARANRDPIVAIIRGTAVNQDGTTNGITAPNGLSQQAVIRSALRSAGVEARQIGYVETHGTGTSLGDPIEVEALAGVLSEPGAVQPCYLGAVKTNIGHLESAAGIAGVIKTALCLRHSYIPPNLHFKSLNPHISLEGTRLRIPTQGQEWQASEGPRLAGVSSFGFGGTNGHAILEQAPADAAVGAVPDRDSTERILTISARTRKALGEMAARYIAFMTAEGSSAHSLQDVAYSASVRRSHLTARAAVVGRTRDEWIEGLRRYQERQANLWPESGLPGIAVGEASGRPRLVFVFSGQGPQWYAMGRELFDREPVYRRTIEQCADLLKRHTQSGSSSSWDLVDELQACEQDSRLGMTEIAQPAIFSLQMGLLALWKSWGLQPDCIIGHSVGEVAASCAAGVLSLEDAIEVVYHRARVMQRATGKGEMAAVGLSAEQAALELKGCEDRLVIAAVNSPSATVLSGDAQALNQVVARLAARGVFARLLQVDYAFHSPVMAPYQQELEAALQGICPQPAKVPIVSTVTGRLAGAGDYGPRYWARNIREPVRFHDAVTTSIQLGGQAFLEISPHPVLSSAISQCLAGADKAVVVASLKRNTPERAMMLTALSVLHANGCPVEWGCFFDASARPVALPRYPWQNSRYWIDAASARRRSGLGRSKSPAGNGGSALLGRIRPEIQLRLEDETDPGSLVVDMRLCDESGAVLARSLAQKPEVCDRNALARALTKGPPERLYEIQWIEKPRDAQQGTAERDARWLVFLDGGGVGEALAEGILARGQTCVRVSRGGTGLTQVEPAHYQMPADTRGEYRRLVRAVLDRSGAQVWHVAYLWALDADEPAHADGPAFEGGRRLGCDAAVWLAQALQQERREKSCRLWLVTRGALPVRNPMPRCMQAPLWGLGRTLAFEMPDVWGGLVDLDPSDDSKGSTELLLQETAFPTDEDQLAFRAGKRFVPRLRRLSGGETSRAASLCEYDASYLVTGSGNGLGLRVAVWLAEQGARHLVVVGRPGESRDSEVAAEWRRAIQNLGAQVRIVEGDPADRATLSAVFDAFGRNEPALRGIVHAAGTIEPVAAGDIDESSIATAFRDKAHAAWLLHALSLQHDLAFFVLFSSASAIMGSRGLAHYGAANHFLDVLCHLRRAQGLPALAVDWGWWPEGGTTQSLDSYYGRIGLIPMSSADALDALAALLRMAWPQAAVTSVDWSVFKPICEAKGPVPFLEDMRAGTEAATEQTRADQGDFPTLWEATPPDMRWQSLVAHVRQQLSLVLGFGDAAEIDITQGFFSMGLDSISTLQFTERLGRSFGRAFPATLAFEHPNVERLCRYLQNEVLGKESAAAAPGSELSEARQAPQIEDGGRLEQMTDDELMNVLAEKLKSLDE